MLQWTMADSGPRFALLALHTDAEREWAYDRKSPIGASPLRAEAQFHGPDTRLSALRDEVPIACITT